MERLSVRVAHHPVHRRGQEASPGVHAAAPGCRGSVATAFTRHLDGPNKSATPRWALSAFT